MLRGLTLRSPYPHARILSIDTTAAKALPGVHAVLVGADLPPDARIGRNMRDMHVLAQDKVRFVGEKVAAVAADTLAIAQEAIGLIEVEYEELEAVFDPREAIQPGAPLIHDPELVRAWATKEQVVPEYQNGVAAPAWGASVEEVEQALAGAAQVFEHTFNTPIQHQVYLEAHACIVEIDDDGIVQIWASQKAPLLLARYLKEGLGLQRDQINIHMLPLGGDFGGKGSAMDIPIAYFLAKATGRPVKLVMSMSEELMAGNPRHASTLVVRSGVDEDGRLVARLVQGYFNSGGYAAFKPFADTTLPGFRRGAIGPYHVPVQRTELHMIYTNTVPTGHMRSPGEAQAAYALEMHTELMARELGIDPIEFRKLNGSIHSRPAEGGGPGVPPTVPEVLDAAVAAIGLDQARPEGIGRGLALIEFSTTPGLYSAILKISADGRLTIQTPIVEQGAGMLTAFKQIVAEELGVSVEQVDVEQSIANIEDDRGVGGGRVTRLVGKLLIQLTTMLRGRLASLLADELGLDVADLEAIPGGFQTPDGRSFSLAQAAALSDGPISERYTFRPTSEDRAVVYMAQAVEVTVDRETGQVKPTRVVSVHEVGRVINPLLFKTQIEGGLLQGLGYALMEEIVVRDGRVVNLNLHEYKIPTMADLPEVEAVLLESDPRLGITPIGEGPNAGLAPAIVSAVMDVVGPYVFDLPLAPEVVRRVANGAARYESGRVRPEPADGRG
jgi:CO/xanthine dehydrogenase Mo-binding subunit